MNFNRNRTRRPPFSPRSPAVAAVAEVADRGRARQASPQPLRVARLLNASTSDVTPEPRAGVGLNPLKDLDLTEGQTFGFPSAQLGFPSAGFGFPSDWLGFPSAQLGIPSGRPGPASLRPSGAAIASDRLWSRKEEAGSGVTFHPRVQHNPLKSPISRDKNRVNFVSKARASRAQTVPKRAQARPSHSAALACCLAHSGSR